MEKKKKKYIEQSTPKTIQCKTLVQVWYLSKTQLTEDQLIRNSP